MEVLLRAAMIAYFSGSSELAPLLNSITEEAPFTSALPFLSIATSSAIDWSTKTEIGEEIRIAFELQCRGDQPNSDAALVAAIDRQVRALPAGQAGFTVVSILFLHSKAEQRSPSTRAIQLEYRFRIQATENA